MQDGVSNDLKTFSIALIMNVLGVRPTGWIFFSEQTIQTFYLSELEPDMRKFMREEGFDKIYVFIRCISCGQITNPTGKFPIKVIKQKWKGE